MYFSKIVLMAAIVSFALAPAAQEPLGDTAKRVKPKDAQTTSKRVFTDDDVKHSSDTSSQQPNPNDKINQAQSLVDKLSGKTPRQLADDVVGENKFPGRDVWERKLSDQRDRVVATAQAAIDLVKKMNSDTSTSAQKANAKSAAEQALSNFDLEKSKYNSLVLEGNTKASDWERKTAN